MQVKERLQALRKLMTEKGVDAYIVVNTDPHMSEYIPEYWKSRQWISGFNGSAGTVVVTQDNAGLWTDGRYYIQAAAQLEGSGIQLFRAADPGVPSFVEWLGTTLKEKACVAFDARLLSVETVRSMEKEWKNKKIVIADHDLVTPLWQNRPALSDKPLFVHDVKYAGKTRQEKLAEVRAEMAKKGAEQYIINSLDDIAWLFNIRGADVPNNPVVSSYALINAAKAYLFVDQIKVSPEIRKEMEKDGVTLETYEAVKEIVEGIPASDKVYIDIARINHWLYQLLGEDRATVEDINITTRLKAMKNSVEIENLRRCYIRDGAALTKFLCWLDGAIDKEEITELSADVKLRSFRQDMDLYHGPSFDTIAGYKDHAAMMHFSATPENTYKLEKKGMFLVDSGGQYLDGTTDVTRTVIMGTPTVQEKTDFTLVLKGVIGLTTAKFLYGAHGCNLDVLARRHLWEAGIDYKCGTGHGIGYFLNVHEGPHNVSMRMVPVRLEPGMIMSNEPGVYREGVHGVRIENIIVAVEREKNEFGQFMGFETLSYYPIDLRGVDVSMLSEGERQWLNDYHAKTCEYLSPYLNDAEKAWLKNATRAI